MFNLRNAVIAAAATLALHAVPSLAQGTGMGSSTTGTPSTGSTGMGSTAMGSSGTGSTAMASAGDKTFVMGAAVSGMTEVELGKLAVSKGASQGVKDYGQKMIDDHTKANDELKSIASPKGIQAPQQPDTAHQRVIAMFTKMSGGADFDMAYQKQMVTDHKKTIAIFQKEAKSGRDADLKAFASKTLPDLQNHLKMVEAMKTM